MYVQEKKPQVHPSNVYTPLAFPIRQPELSALAPLDPPLDPRHLGTSLDQAKWCRVLTTQWCRISPDGEYTRLEVYLVETVLFRQ